MKDRSVWRREFYCNKQSIFQKTSNFYLSKFELKYKLGLYITFDELVDIILPNFQSNYSALC